MIDVSFEAYKDEVAIQMFAGEEKLPTINTDFVGAADVLGQLATAYKIEDLFAVIQDNKPMSLNMIRYDKKIDFIDLYHFSTPGKSDKYCYYNPVMKILFNKNRK